MKPYIIKLPTITIQANRKLSKKEAIKEALKALCQELENSRFYEESKKLFKITRPKT
jgi:DNA-directed RNA polymerase subunit L